MVEVYYDGFKKVYEVREDGEKMRFKRLDEVLDYLKFSIEFYIEREEKEKASLYFELFIEYNWIYEVFVNERIIPYEERINILIDEKEGVLV